MATNDISDYVFRLLDNEKFVLPKNINERIIFITERLSKIWDALLDINIFSNIGISTENDKQYVTYYDRNSQSAWSALGETLILAIVLEDMLNVDIKFAPKYGGPNEFNIEKAKIRSKISC